MKALLERIRGAAAGAPCRPAERRRHPRVALADYDLYYLRSSLLDAKARRADVVDLSREGICFEAEEALERGAEIALRLRVPYTERFVRATGRVLRVEPAAGGIRHRVAVRYAKLVNGTDETLFDTILDLLA